MYQPSKITTFAEMKPIPKVAKLKVDNVQWRRKKVTKSEHSSSSEDKNTNQEAKDKKSV